MHWEACKRANCEQAVMTAAVLLRCVGCNNQPAQLQPVRPRLISTATKPPAPLHVPAHLRRGLPASSAAPSSSWPPASAASSAAAEGCA